MLKSSKKNILIILPSDNQVGGVEIPLYEFVRKTKHRIDIIYMKKLMFVSWRNNELTKITLRQILSSKYDLIFSFFWQPAIFLFFLRMKYEKLVYFENSTIQYTSYRKFLQTYLRRKSDIIIYDSLDTLHQNRKFSGVSKTFVIPFIPEDLAHRLKKNNIYKKKFHNKVCVVTRWSKEKGIDHFNHFSDRVLSNVVVASPQLIPSVIRQSCAAVIDGKKRDLVWKLYRDSNFSLSLSEREGLGISILEAVAENCIPLIISNHFIKTIIEENFEELKVKTIEDIERILTLGSFDADQVVSLLTILRNELSKNNYDIAFSQNMEDWIQKYT